MLLGESSYVIQLSWQHRGYYHGATHGWEASTESSGEIVVSGLFASPLEAIRSLAEHLNFRRGEANDTYMVELPIPQRESRRWLVF